MSVNMTKTKPIHEVRLGCIKAAVWKNEIETGARYNVTFRRLYKDGDQWKTTESFGRDDLLLLGKVADQTHTWIVAQHQEHNTRDVAGGVKASPPAPAAAASKKVTPCRMRAPVIHN